MNKKEMVILFLIVLEVIIIFSINKSNKQKYTVYDLRGQTDCVEDASTICGNLKIGKIINVDSRGQLIREDDEVQKKGDEFGCFCSQGICTALREENESKEDFWERWLECKKI